MSRLCDEDGMIKGDKESLRDRIAEIMALSDPYTCKGKCRTEERL